MRTTAYSTVRPRYGFADIVGLLFRELLLMAIVFLVLFALGAAAVLTLKKSYTASASVYAGVGQEYVYQSRVGGQADRIGQAPEADAVAQSEAAILGSLEVKRRTVRALGPDAILGGAAGGSSPDRETAALKALDNSLGVGVAPGSAIISASYKSGDPERAAHILNGLIDQYLLRRREVFRDRADPAPYAAQRQAFEGELAAADAAYATFLRSNNIGDFATAKATLSATYQSVFTETLSVRAQLNQASQRLSTLEAQLSRQPAEVVLQQDLNVSAQDQILQLRTERETLLARYTPDAQPVREIDERIAQLQAYVATGTAVGAREVRTGPSVIFTEIETTRINAAADRDALAARLRALESQLSTLRARLADLTRLESTHATLAGNRETLTAAIRDFQQRESQSRADSALVAAGADNVTVIERAQAPTRGSSLKAPLLAVVFLFAAFTALCLGLVRVFTRKGYATPASAGRTLELPVLAVAPMKAG